MVTDLRRGGQLGVGLDASSIDSATPLALTPAVVVVLKTPTMYDKKPNIAAMIKNVIETCPKAISGIDIEYTLGVGDSAAGHDGQAIRIPTQTTRSPVDPSFTFNEVTGNTIWELFTTWLRDIQDPDTNGSFTHMAFQDAAELPTYLLSAISMTMLTIQFDQTMLPNRIITAGLITNMFPISTGPFGMQRTVGETQVPERSIAFVGNIHHTPAIRTMAIDIATTLRLAQVRYSTDSALSRVAPQTTVDEGLADGGLVAEATDAIGSVG